MQEQEMIDLLKQHDEEGLKYLLKHYSPLMRYIISPILSNEQDREECLSETAMRIWDKIHTYNQQKGSWNTWLTAVTRSVALNYVRKNTRLQVAEEIQENVPSKEPTPEQSVIRQEQMAAVKRALDQLSSKERLLFYRKYYYLQSTSQIAAELGMSQRAVEGKLYRLKKRLRKLLGGEGHE